MPDFRPFFRHGKAVGDLRTPPKGAASPVDPHSWSLESTLSSGSDPLQNVPLIPRSAFNRKDRQDRDSLHAPQLTIPPEPQRNGPRGALPALIAFVLSAGAATFFLGWLRAHRVNSTALVGKSAFVVDESRSFGLTGLAISAFTVSSARPFHLPDSTGSARATQFS